MSSRSAGDWLLLFALSAMWGSAFLFIKLGVATVPPATLVAGRLALGAIILYAALCWRGLRLPRLGRDWWPYAVLAVVGNAAPFYLISWGQQTITSALAGILMAIMPRRRCCWRIFMSPAIVLPRGASPALRSASAALSC